jgi:hypothetical protein
MTAASTVAAPRSSAARFNSRDGFSHNDDPRQYRRDVANPGDDVTTLTQFHCRTGRRDAACAHHRRPVAARRQPGRFPRRVETPDLSGDRGDAREAPDEDRDQARDGQCRFDRAETSIA